MTQRQFDLDLIAIVRELLGAMKDALEGHNTDLTIHRLNEEVNRLEDRFIAD